MVGGRHRTDLPCLKGHKRNSALNVRRSCRLRSFPFTPKKFLPHVKRVEDIRSQTFGNYTVLEFVGLAPNNRMSKWLWRCAVARSTWYLRPPCVPITNIVPPACTPKEDK